MTNHHISRARPLRALSALAVALAIVAASLAAAPPQASAAPTDQRCNYDFVEFNACLRFDYLGVRSWNAQVGIDVYMPEHIAQEILACGADFRASLHGDDGGNNDPLIRNLVIKPGWPIAAPASPDYPSHLAAEFAVPLHSSQLNEDHDGEDELYTRISFYDCRHDLTRQFVTGTVRDYF